MASNKPHAGADDFLSMTAQTALEAPPTLSHIERLPTEVVQHIATDLVRSYQGHPRDTIFVNDAGASSFNGLLELRATSKTIMSKTEHIFNRSFETTVIGYDAKSLLRLWDVSVNDTLCPRVRSLVFARGPDVDTGCKTHHCEKVIGVLNTRGMREVVSQFDLITAMITMALKRLSLHSVLVAPSLVTYYSRDITDTWAPAWPATTVILNSVLLSKIWLKRFEMGGGEWGTCEGIQPPETQVAACSRLGWSQVRNLKSISLNLSASNYYHTANGLACMLQFAWNLEHLCLKMDKASIEDSWPHLEEPEALWIIGVSGARYWNLQTLALSGFAFEGRSLERFLTNHQQTLTKIHLDNCDLDGPWEPTFEILRNAPCLVKLRLHQISEIMQRMIWIDADEVLMVEAVHDDWICVMHGFQHQFILDGRATAEEWGALLEKLRYSRRQASPFMEDALSWYPEFLT